MRGKEVEAMPPFRRHWQKRFGDAPWGPGGRFFDSGDVRLVLLGLIAEQPGHGYELMTRLTERLGGAYEPSAGSVYPVLQQLEDEGLVRSESDGGRKVYHATEEGAKQAKAHAEEVAEIWQRAKSRSEWGFMRHPHSAEVVRPAVRLLKAAVKASVKANGDPDVVNRLRSILETAQKDVEAVGKKAKA
ncbi:MAG: PadR family transcriptional regulator [Chloroflexi bacterium]|nr:PadR family transcriptional regulator [Chloroflexota bacterium]